MHELDPLDPAYVADVLSKPPFIAIPGILNVRDLGSYPSTTFPGKVTKPRHLYRSAEIAGVLPEGMSAGCFQLRISLLTFSDSQVRPCLRN